MKRKKKEKIKNLILIHATTQQTTQYIITMSEINIIPSAERLTRETEFGYRYTMPPVCSQLISGRKPKTIIKNLPSIASSLNRENNEIMHYFKLKLNSKIALDDSGRYIIYGTHSNATLQSEIYKLIDDFILCATCKNPETKYLQKKSKKNKKKEKLVIHCDACGAHTKVSKTCPKQVKFVLKQLKNIKSSKRKKKKSKGSASTVCETEEMTTSIRL